jgi:hypothetical protein
MPDNKVINSPEEENFIIYLRIGGSTFLFYYGPITSRGPKPHIRVSSITLIHTTLGRTSLEEWSARRRDLYLTTQQSQETGIHATCRIRTCNPRKWSVVDPRLRNNGHWGWAFPFLLVAELRRNLFLHASRLNFLIKYAGVVRWLLWQCYGLESAARFQLGVGNIRQNLQSLSGPQTASVV